MEQLFEQMKEYLKMEDELGYPLFSAYYYDMMNFLQAEYQDLSGDELVQAQAICSIIRDNAQMCAAKKDINRKKFLKIQEKSDFWQGAIKARLIKEGMSEKELAQKAKGLWD